MSVPKLYNQILDLSLSEVKKYRKKAIIQAVGALSRGARANLTGIRRALSGKAKVKHKIKKIDRLLGNEHLFAELPGIYKRLIQIITFHLKECVIAIDWSAYPIKDYVQLRASLIYQGRAIPLYSVLTKLEQMNNALIQQQFLLHLQQSIGLDKRVIIVTDNKVV